MKVLTKCAKDGCDVASAKLFCKEHSRKLTRCHYKECTRKSKNFYCCEHNERKREMKKAYQRKHREECRLKKIESYEEDNYKSKSIIPDITLDEFVGLYENVMTNILAASKKEDNDFNLIQSHA